MSIDFKLEEGVAWVTINRPERMNAIDGPSEIELEKIWSAIEADNKIGRAHV